MCVVSGSGYFSLFSVVVVVVVMNVYYVSQSDYITVMYYLCLIIVCQTGFIYSLKKMNGNVLGLQATIVMPLASVGNGF